MEAVLVGYFLGGEALGLRTILGLLFLLIGVVGITTTPGKNRGASRFRDGVLHHLAHHRGASHGYLRLQSFINAALLMKRMRSSRTAFSAWVNG